MSGLGQGGKGSTKLALLDQERCFSADMLQDPDIDWPIILTAGIEDDESNISPTVRVFTDTEESGAGFIVRVPDRATAMRFRIRGRSRGVTDEDEPTITVRLYSRQLEEWLGPAALGIVKLPVDGSVHDSLFAITLSGLGVTPNKFTQFEITRNPGKTDNLVGDYLIHEVGLNFIVG